MADDVNGYWRNRSFHNYEGYALSASFRQGLTALVECGRRETCVVMCAEAVWWRCHRRIIADHLIHCGETVFHLMNGVRAESAALTEAARVRGNGDLIYPASDVAKI